MRALARTAVGGEVWLGSDSKVLVWQMNTRKLLKKLSAAKAPVTSLILTSATGDVDACGVGEREFGRECVCGGLIVHFSVYYRSTVAE